MPDMQVVSSDTTEYTIDPANVNYFCRTRKSSCTGIKSHGKPFKEIIEMHLKIAKKAKQGLSIDTLRAICKDNKLNSDGKKHQLIQRLLATIDEIVANKESLLNHLK